MQVKELHEAFEKMDSEGVGKGTLKAERFTRAQSQETEAGVELDETDAAPEGGKHGHPTLKCFQLTHW